MTKENLIKRVEHLINQGQNVIRTQKYGEFVGNYVDHGLQMGFRSASLSFIENLYGSKHNYYKDFDQKVKGDGLSESKSGINILNSIKVEIENDWLLSIKELVTSEIFADFLEMSKHFLDLKYKDPAAVMIGSTLEEHLRQLCNKHSVDTTFEKNGDLFPKKANLLNANLVKAEAYGVLEQKNVTAWLDLRNRAAHGKYGEYSIEQVDLMYQGVLNFIMTTK
ncbi:hypothetical protein VBZ51_15505 [Maribacter sp. HS]|uniref:hypothetical protein n=1 Tax=Maribacter sp. HS TaxID=3110480 RepID=UPI003A839EAB